MLSKSCMRLVLLSVVILAIFTIYSPSVDQSLASMTYNTANNTFIGEHCRICDFIYSLVTVFTISIIVIFILGLFTAQRKLCVIVLLSLALGPGLLVNSVFKTHWGRPRPYQVLRGQAAFAPVWKPDFTAPDDNSFASGHASIGFFLGVPLFVFGRKKAGIIVGLLGGSVIGAVRIMQGGHYLSDVVFAGIFVCFATMLIMWIFSCLIPNCSKL